MLQRIARFAQPVFLALAAIAIVLLLHSQWETIRQYPWRILPALLTLSVVLQLATWAVEVEIWRRILVCVGGELAYPPAVRIWFLSAVLRYIPGNVWQPLGMTVYCMRYGIRPEITVTSIALYQVVILLAVAPFVAVYVWAGSAAGFLAFGLAEVSLWLVALAIMPPLVFILKPTWLLAVLNWLLIKVSRPPLDAQLSSRSLLVFVALAVINWLMWGMTFAIFTFAIVDLTGSDMSQLLPLLVLSYPIAYAVGFISFFTPSGFGVREGAFYLLLSPVVPGGVVTVTALAMRLLTAVGELALALISFPFERAPGRVQISAPKRIERDRTDSLSPGVDRETSRPLP